MSQRIYRYKNYEIFTGWDVPLQYFFLVIEDLADDGDDYIFSNLKRKNPGMTLEEIQQVLTELNIPYPVELMIDLQKDKDNQDQKLICNYGEFPFLF